MKPTQDPYSPCHCGSGKKYKFCCLARDREAARRAVTEHVGLPTVVGDPLHGLQVSDEIAPDALAALTPDLAIPLGQLRLELGDQRIEAFTEYYLGEALSIQHMKHPKAIEHYQTALEITEKLGVLEARGDLLMQLTNLCAALGKRTLDLGYCERLQSIARKYGGDYPTMVAPRCLGSTARTRRV